MRELIVIWLKEMRDTIRDRRTLMVMVLVPILLTPALLIGMNALASSNANKPVHVAVTGATAAPELVQFLRSQPLVIVDLRTDPIAEVKGGNADAGLIIAPDFAGRIAAGKAGRIQVATDATKLGSSRADTAITNAVDQYRTQVVTKALRAHGMDPAILTPVQRISVDVATKQALAGYVLSLLLPLFIVMYAISGGMYAAMDLSAGEKERSTLEALLLSPATKLQITLGKLLAVSTVGVCTVILAVASLVVALQRMPITLREGTDLSFNWSADTVALVVLLGILLAVAFAALELTLGIFARSFKEAQNYITPLYLVAIVPVAALASIPDLKPALAFFLIPALNAALVFKEALVGATDGLHVALTVASMLLFCLLAIGATVRIFSNEKVLLRS
ncbi:MAG TPA: ABC transporter permease [Chloroflexota bacterium]|nr:ABC transporter permease [Chloroflexota bacterium]